MTGLVHSCEQAVQRFGWSLILGAAVAIILRVHSCELPIRKKEGKGGDVAADYRIYSSSHL
jgi:hypothetical protein